MAGGKKGFGSNAKFYPAVLHRMREEAPLPALLPCLRCGESEALIVIDFALYGEGEPSWEVDCGPCMFEKGDLIREGPGHPSERKAVHEWNALWLAAHVDPLEEATGAGVKPAKKRRL